MSDGQLVRIEWRNRVALLTIDNPPLNLLKAAVRAALLAAIRTAAASDPERIVITGAGKAFVAGADAREFGDAPIEPHLNDVLREIAQLSVPTIAAINGSALGGGLEMIVLHPIPSPPLSAWTGINSIPCWSPTGVPRQRHIQMRCRPLPGMLPAAPEGRRPPSARWNWWPGVPTGTLMSG